MSELRALTTMLAVALLSTVAITLLQGGRAVVPSGTLDPAAEHYTASHSAAYGGIDRWAFRGQSEGELAARLAPAGYGCTRVKPDETECTRVQRWPLQRILRIHASLDVAGQPRVLALRAESRLAHDGAVARSAAALLRRVGAMEPQALAVRGFEIDTVELLSRVVVDALLHGGWAGLCETAGSANACARVARQRRAEGYAPVPQTVQVGEAVQVVRALEALRLDPVALRGPDDQPADALLVRVQGTGQWLDFEGSDLAGHRIAVGVQLAMEGGTPSKLVLQLDDHTQELALKGTARTANGGDVMFLLPQAGAEPRRFATWLRAPDPRNDTTLAIVRARLPEADPAFQPLLVKRFLDTLATQERPEVALGLYPALLLVEQRGEALREAGAPRWLPRDESGQLVLQGYADDPVTRAAWVRAVCEPDFDTIGADPACWHRALVSDPALARLLRDELAPLQTQLAALDRQHPLRLRLDRWQALVDTAR